MHYTLVPITESRADDRFRHNVIICMLYKLYIFFILADIIDVVLLFLSFPAIYLYFELSICMLFMLFVCICPTFQ